MGQSKKAMLSSKGNPSKLVFDDAGDSHAIYELGDEETFREAGDAEQQRKEFVDKAGQALAKQDLVDKERQREKKRELKRKRKDVEREVRLAFPSFPSCVNCTDELLSTQSRGDTGEGLDFDPDDEIVHPDFSGIDLGSDSDDGGRGGGEGYDSDEAPQEKAARPPVQKKQRRARFDEEDEEERPKVDLEALALAALARR
jgi:ATP-dependent RNA helicase DDX10/DBP4